MNSKNVGRHRATTVCSNYNMMQDIGSVQPSPSQTPQCNHLLEIIPSMFCVFWSGIRTSENSIAPINETKSPTSSKRFVASRLTTAPSAEWKLSVEVYNRQTDKQTNERHRWKRGLSECCYPITCINSTFTKGILLLFHFIALIIN